MFNILPLLYAGMLDNTPFYRDGGDLATSELAWNFLFAQFPP